MTAWPLVGPARGLFTAVLWAVEAGGARGWLAAVLDDFEIRDYREGLAMVILVSAFNAVIWPLALRLTFPFAFFTLGLFTLVLNGAVVWLAGEVLGGVDVDVWAGIIVAFVLVFVQVLLGALLNQADDSYDRRIIRRAAPARRAGTAGDRRAGRAVPGDRRPRRADHPRRAGRGPDAAPASRWLDDGSHLLRRWEPDLSSQTGASQAGILLGNSTRDVVAFRWWDRERKRLRQLLEPEGRGRAGAASSRTATGCWPRTGRAAGTSSPATPATGC